jgi:hypothetical protein
MSLTKIIVEHFEKFQNVIGRYLRSMNILRKEKEYYA